MLYDIPSMKRLTFIPFEANYRPLRQSLDQIDPDAYRRIQAELTSRFDVRAIDTAGWIPGADWSGTVWEPIFLAANEDQTRAAQFFGQLVWEAVVNHPDCWSSGRYELNGVPIQSRTYFRIDCPD